MCQKNSLFSEVMKTLHCPDNFSFSLHQRVGSKSSPSKKKEMYFSKCKVAFENTKLGRKLCSRMKDLKTLLVECRVRTGLLYAVVSCFFFATSSLLVHVVHEIHAVQAVFYRSLLQLVLTVPMLIYHGINPFPQRENPRVAGLLFLRGAAGSTALCFQFYAFQHMPLSDATVIIFSSPIFTGILAYCFLGETWSKVDVASTVLCFLGVLLIARPTDFLAASFESRRHFLCAVVALVGAVLTSFSIIFLKNLRTTHYLVPSFYLALVGTLGTGLVCLCTGVLHEVVCGHQALIVVIGLCAVGKRL